MRSSPAMRAPSLSCLLCALSCASGEPLARAPGAAPNSEAAPAQALAVSQPEVAPALSPLPVQPASSAAVAAGGEPALLAATPEPAELTLEREPLYRVGSRPFPAAPVVASVHDTELGRWNQGGKSDVNPPALPGYHPATRVVLDTKLLSGKKALGRLTAASVLAQTRNQGYWPFRLCFEEALRNGAEPHQKAVLRFSIDTRGRVSYARKMSSPADRVLADCFRKASYEPRFQPAPARRVDVELTAQLGRGDVQLPSRRSAKASEQASAAEPSGELGQDALDALAPQVNQCFASGLARDGELWGRVELRLVRDAQGAVIDVSELDSHFPDAEVTACLQNLLRGLTLSAPPGQDMVVAWRLGTLPLL